MELVTVLNEILSFSIALRSNIRRDLDRFIFVFSYIMSDVLLRG